jgi:glycosyltransferase involved in cell wall biosynthesis
MNTILNAPLALYYLPLPEKDRWIPGDRYIRKKFRNIVRGKPRPGGVDMVFINLCKGLDRLEVPYEVNKPFSQLDTNQVVAILGRGKECLQGYHQDNSIVAGIGLMTHPAEWPDLCQQYPVKKYLQHSDWCNNLYIPYYGAEICSPTWAVGIDTEFWLNPPQSHTDKDIDVLIYYKIKWEKDWFNSNLVIPIKNKLSNNQIKYQELKYGDYQSADYKNLLTRSKAMLFLTEHESQGLAYQEAMSMNVPILAWNPGKIMDPQYKQWGDFGKPASSVPFFDEHCGMTFQDFEGFDKIFSVFWGLIREFNPRNYVLENLTLEKCANDFIDLVANIEPC